MKLLFISHLYPNAVRPQQALYNRQLIRAVGKRVEARVIAPCFRFPGQSLFGRRLPPSSETMDGIRVTHPRVLYSPRLLIHRHAFFYRCCVEAHFRQTIESFQPDHIMIGFAFPDGAALAPLCREFGAPWSIRVNGSDFRCRIRQAKFRGLVLNVLNDAPLIFCPGQALKRDMAAEGIEESKIITFNNGVNHEVFRCRDKAEAIAGLGETARRIVTADGRRWTQMDNERKKVLFVGNLLEVKGPDRLLTAFARLRHLYSLTPTRPHSHTSASPHAHTPTLLLIGDGPMRRGLMRQARRLGISGSVAFLGSRRHDEVARWMNVADCLCLPSRSEGMPNVVMEALASGAPVVATSVGEVPLLVEDGRNGRVVGDGPEESVPERLAAALAGTLAAEWDRQAISECMSAYTWEAAAEAILGGIGGK